jgi:hypothetical protein
MTASPTCVVRFADGEITRMTTWSASGKPDVPRGVRLAQAAYESRTKRKPPAIAELHFETADGVMLLSLKADEITEATKIAEAAQ